MLKKLFAVMLALVMIISIVPLSITSSAGVRRVCCGLDDEGNEAVFYEYDTETHVLNIFCTTSGIGTMDIVEYGWDVTYTLPENIETVIIGNGVSNVAFSAFMDNTSIKNVVLGDSVTLVDNTAFYGCTNLESVQLGNNIQEIKDGAFGNCSSLEEIVLPDSLVKVGNNVFKDCTNLQSITFPDSVTIMGGNVCNGCTSLTTADLGDGITVVPNYSFQGCTALSSVSFGENLNGIGMYAFQGCTSLQNITLPQNLTSIERYAFGGCTSFQSVIIPDSVVLTRENGYIFRGCTNLINVAVGSGIGCIPFGTFKECSAFSKIYFHGTAEEWAAVNKEADLPNVTVIFADGNCDHEYELTETVAPTCYAEGYEEYTCSLCGDTYRKTLPITHNFGEYTVTIKPTCVEPGWKVRYCSICGKADYAEIAELGYYDNTGHIPGPYQVIKNPTVHSPGAEAIYCTRCETYYNQRAIPKLNPDLVISISLSSSKEVLLVGETSAISATVTPENTENKNVIWTSSDTSVAEVDNGIITAIAPGAAVIIAETEDGGYKDFCLVQVFSVNAQNGAQIDSADGFIYGLAPKLDSVADYLGLDDESVSLSYSSDVIGTGTKVYVKQGSTLISEYQVVIFGDVNGDGIYDGQDAFIVNCLANGALTREQVGEAKYLAADCNHDGEVNASDVLILEQAGLLLANVDQSKDDYIETDAYAEYLDLIDQTPTIDETPEAPTEPEAPSQPSLFEKIVEFIRNIINFIRSIIVK